MFPNTGKNSNKKKPKTWSCPVKIAIPVINKIKPPNLVTKDIYFLKFLEKNINLWIKIPEIIKGIAKPNE